MLKRLHTAMLFHTLLSFLVCTISSAQQHNYQFERFTVNEGLSANTVLCILQDSRGFLWIGTYDGLSKYDGYKFTIYKHSVEDAFSLSDNKVRAICEDKNGDLWIGTWEGGLNKFDRETERFFKFENSPDDPNSICPGGIFSIQCDQSGNLWVGTESNGLDYLDIQKGIFHHFRHNANDEYSLSSNGIHTLYIDKNNNLWVGTSAGGLNMYVKDRDQFIRYLPSKKDGAISGQMITSIHEDSFGNLWIATRDGGLNKLNSADNKFKRYVHEPGNSRSVSDNYIWTVCDGPDNSIWIGTHTSGLSILELPKESFKHVKKNYFDPKSLSDDVVFSSLKDNTNIIWIGTWSGGLNKYDYSKQKFLTYSYNPNIKNGLSSNSIYSIYKDKYGDLWVGTETGGLNRIDEKNNKFTHYLHNPSDRTSLSSNSIFSICEDLDGNLWVGTDIAGINKFKRTTNNFERFQNDVNNPNSIGSDGVTQIFCDSYGDLWIGVSGSGLDRLKRNQKGFIHYKHDPENPKSISPELVYSFYEDRGKNLWIGTFGAGLMLYNRKTDDFSFYKYDLDNPKTSLSHNIVSSLCEDSNGTLWIGTNGGGLNKFNRLKNTFKQYSEKDGLANNIVYGILADDQGNLWISTGKGISKFNIESQSFHNFTSSDGLQDNEFNAWAYHKNVKGEMYFGGVNGFNKFNPNEIKINTDIPNVVITDFRLLHKPVGIGYDSLWGRIILQKSITETRRIELNHDDNIISFEIAALDFHNPENNKYAYLLEGFDESWTYIDASRRIVTYTNLDPGHYVLNIKASNNDGVWNRAGTSLDIIIHPPWWSTWWSYILYGFVSALIFISGTRFYLNRQKLKTQLQLEQEHAKKLEEVDKMKSNFYANISHEFRTPLMLILGPVEKLLLRINDVDSKKQAGLIKGNAKRLLNLINQLLDLSRIEAGKLKLNASYGNIVHFVKGLVMEFESIAEQKDITLSLIVEKNNIGIYFDNEKLEKIITNLLSNAIKFTPEGGRITVSISELSDQFVEIIIRDSGIGIPKSELLKIFDRFYQVDGSHTREHEGTGIGLALAKELVVLHRGQISVDSVEGHWTEFKIELPLGREHLFSEEIVEETKTELREIEPQETLTSVSEDEDECLNENIIDKIIVLVVEDNPDVRDYIKDALKDQYHVEEAANGEQGLRKAEKCIPDLIVSDIMMPKMDGYQMTKSIKLNDKTSHIPIILLTAKSDKNSKLEGLGIGADDYIVKPFDSDELIARIKNLIETRKMLQEKFGNGATLFHRSEKNKISSIDEQFLSRVLKVIDEHISEEGFSIEEFGKDVGMSRSQIHRKLKALTGKSTSLYLRTVRLAKAKQLIEQKKGNISEVSYQVGFSSPAYFSRCFKEEFGFAPSEIP